MATKRKQQTVQFLFEASPENNITRCLISSTSNTFENNEKTNYSNDRSSQIAADKITNHEESLHSTGNNEELNGLQERSSARRGLNKDEESDEEDKMKTEDEGDQIETGKVRSLREFSYSFYCTLSYSESQL